MLPTEVVQAISKYLLHGSIGFHASRLPKLDGTDIRYSVCNHSIENRTIPHFVALRIIFGCQLDILESRMQLIMNDTDVLGSLPGKDWLSNPIVSRIHPAVEIGLNPFTSV
ncbi:hypothetical protein FOVG_19988 [Fusarium oxysporum f. sp. pisi HDV247]|uniref:Uncharacterized protein n=1 Tax=Fusarium oxysporum f. sp. pisi HDV247 TaxID=1080344 RepID=W9NCH8_FUSOX|nr:hypothetical protein FOVG_19988 [Fusarium oxysporum f. sp. pisi HDV247]